jgi:aspartate aminotransferase
MVMQQQLKYPIEQVPDSGLHAIFRAAQRWSRRHGREAIGLHVGEPAFAMPDVVVAAMCRAIHENRCAYTTAEGMPELREALVERLAGRRIDTTTDRVFVTPGSCQGLASVGAAVYTPGAEWLIPRVHWPIYLQQAKLNGYQVAGYPLGVDYALDVDAVAAAATSDTRVVVVNSPANPTGAMADTSSLRRLLELACERDWLIVSDEAYEDFVYEGRHVPMASLEADIEPHCRRVFSAFTFSKSYAMTGCRVGYIVAPNDALAELLRRVQEASIIAPPTPAQVGALAALGATEQVAANVDMVRRSRDAVMDDLIAEGLINSPPAGGWYALLDISSSGCTAEQFAARLLAEHGVAVAPAPAFAMPDDSSTNAVVRISFAGDRSRLLEGTAALIEACRQWGDELPSGGVP